MVYISYLYNYLYWSSITILSCVSILGVSMIKEYLELKYSKTKLS